MAANTSARFLAQKAVLDSIDLNKISADGADPKAIASIAHNKHIIAVVAAEADKKYQRPVLAENDWQAYKAAMKDGGGLSLPHELFLLGEAALAADEREAFIDLLGQLYKAERRRFAGEAKGPRNDRPKEENNNA